MATDKLVDLEEATDFLAEQACGPFVGDPDFSAGPFVTRRNPTEDISSLLSSLYIDDECNEQGVGGDIDDDTDCDDNDDL